MAITTIAGILVIGTVIAVAMYAYVFLGAPLSRETSDWGLFGSYVGGVVGPLVALLAVVVVYVTYVETRRANQFLQVQQIETTFHRSIEAFRQSLEHAVGARGKAYAEELKAIDEVRGHEDMEKVASIYTRFPEIASVGNTFKHVVWYLEESRELLEPRHSHLLRGLFLSSFSALHTKTLAVMATQDAEVHHALLRRGYLNIEHVGLIFPSTLEAYTPKEPFSREGPTFVKFNDHSSGTYTDYKREDRRIT